VYDLCPESNRFMDWMNAHEWATFVAMINDPWLPIRGAGREGASSHPAEWLHDQELAEACPGSTKEPERLQQGAEQLVGDGKTKYKQACLLSALTDCVWSQTEVINTKQLEDVYKGVVRMNPSSQWLQPCVIYALTDCVVIPGKEHEDAGRRGGSERALSGQLRDHAGGVLRIWDVWIHGPLLRHGRLRHIGLSAVGAWQSRVASGIPWRKT
jgi:hypothetical protein